MTSDRDASLGEESESHIQTAISMFESIIQTLPTDRVSLEALSQAYAQIGNTAKARDYLLRLAHVVADEHDRETAEHVRDLLKPYIDSDPLVAEAARHLDEMLLSPSPAADTKKNEKATAPDAGALRSHNVIADEMEFAWNLLRAGELSQEEYASVIQVLTDLSASGNIMTISVLHALMDLHSAKLENVLNYTAKQSDMPIIPLGSFEPQPEAYALLPLSYIVRQGVIPFERIGTDILMAVLNPYNKTVLAEVETATRRKCHYFLTPPADFDSCINAIYRQQKIESTH
jgi:hypothetical protein